MSRPASPARAIAAMTAMELRLVLRRGENLFATIVIPTLVLVLFSSVAILPTGAGRPVDFLLPGSIALGDHLDEPRQPRDHDRLRALVRRPEAARRVAAEPRPSWSSPGS